MHNIISSSGRVEHSFVTIFVCLYYVYIIIYDELKKIITLVFSLKKINFRECINAPALDTFICIFTCTNLYINKEGSEV